MRKASIATLVVMFFFACINVSAQNTTPQWKVVKALQVTNQSSQTSLITLFTPAKIGAYRVTGYISAVGPNQNADWVLNFYWTDVTGVTEFLYAFASPGGGVSSTEVGTLGPVPFSPQPGIPVQLQIESSSPPPVDSTYSFWLTVEQLE